MEIFVSAYACSFVATRREAGVPILKGFGAPRVLRDAFILGGVSGLTEIHSGLLGWHWERQNVVSVFADGESL